MFCSQTLLQRCFFTLFLLGSPVPHHGRPVDGLSGRTRRSVAHAQLMHDKGRTLQDFKRRMWLQELLDDVHTADVRELAARAAGGLRPKAPAWPEGGAFGPQDEEGTTLPQETNESRAHKDGGGLPEKKKKKKVRAGKRRDGEKRRRGRSLGRLRSERGRGPRLGWRGL